MAYVLSQSLIHQVNDSHEKNNSDARRGMAWSQSLIHQVNDSHAPSDDEVDQGYLGLNPLFIRSMIHT